MFKKNFYFIVLVIIVLHLFLFLGCDNYNPDSNYSSNITGVSPSHLYDRIFINNTSNNLLFSFLPIYKNNTNYNLSFVTYNNISFITRPPIRYVQFKIFKTNDGIYHPQYLTKSKIDFHDEQTNFIFRITNFISDMISRKEITTNDIGIKFIKEIIEIENSTLTNAYWGTTNE